MSASSSSQNACRSSTRHLIRRLVSTTCRSVSAGVTSAWRVSPRGIANQARLAALRGRFGGERCFILGNGPSLNETDLDRLRDEWLIGTNRIYLHPASGRWRRWMYCCVNPNVLGQFSAEIDRLECPKFLPWEHRRLVSKTADVTWLRTRHEPRFSFQIGDAIWQGATVTYAALQVAFYLGFREVNLLGVDHRFAASGSPNTLVESSGADRDHFSDAYFGAGVRWQLPDLEQSESAYRLAKHAFEQNGRRIRNATPGSGLAIFPSVRYDDLF
ncbi:MAG: hypothetical protein AAFR96_11235 [Planctomycetota bacterium]